MANAHYPALIAEFKSFGKRYTKAQLADPNWIIKEIARLGYSIVIRHDTAERYLEHVKDIGKANPDEPFFQENYDAIKKMGGMFTEASSTRRTRATARPSAPTCTRRR